MSGLFFIYFLSYGPSFFSEVFHIAFKKELLLKNKMKIKQGFKKKKPIPVSFLFGTYKPFI